MMSTVNRPTLFVGESGTAKTVTIQNFLESKDPETNLILNINFSSRTNAQDTYVNITENVDKRTAKVYGPPTGKILHVFVDDLNMPTIDTYGTQQPIAFLLFLGIQAFAIALGLLSPSIHAARLHFVEWMGKFHSGSEYVYNLACRLFEKGDVEPRECSSWCRCVYRRRQLL